MNRPTGPTPSKGRRKGKLIGGKGWVISTSGVAIVPTAMPKEALMRVVESTDDVLIVQTPNRLWWPGPCFLLVLAGVFVFEWPAIVETLHRQVDVGLGYFAGGAFVGAIFVAITAFLSTHQWLRVAPDGVEYQLRLGPWKLGRKTAFLSQITDLVLGDSDADLGPSYFLILKTVLWEARFGAEFQTGPVDYLVHRVRQVQATANVSAPASERNSPR